MLKNSEKGKIITWDKKNHMEKLEIGVRKKLS